MRDEGFLRLHQRTWLNQVLDIWAVFCMDQDHLAKAEVQVDWPHVTKFSEFDPQETLKTVQLITAASSGIPPIDCNWRPPPPPPRAPCLVSEQLAPSHRCAHSRYVANRSPSALSLSPLSIPLCPLKPFPSLSLFLAGSLTVWHV